MKRKWSLAWIALSIVSLLAACTNGGGDSAEGGDRKKVKLIVGGNVQEFPDGVTKDDNFIMDYWREHSGFDIEIEILPLEGGDEKLNAMLVSGDAEGIIIRGGTEWIANLVHQDALEPLDEHLAGTSLESVYPDIQSGSTIVGKRYGILMPDAIAAQGAAFLVRKDWVLESGMKDQPKTFAEFNDMLKKFKDRGVVPIGISGPPNGAAFSPFMGMFGIPTEFALQGGKVVYNPIRPEAKRYLEYMAQLYKDGMIPKDFSMLNGQSLQEMFTGNQIGLFVLDYPWPSKTIIPTMSAAGADVKFMDFPTGADGKPSYSRAYFPIGPSAAIVKGTKDVKAAVEFIEFLLKPETQEITNYGIEGRHFTRDGDTIVPTQEGLEIAWSVYFKQLARPEEWYNMYGVMAEWAEYYYPVERNSAKEDVDPVFFMPPQPDLVAKKTDLATKVDTFYTEVVMGQRSVNDFDAFAQDWLKSGGQDILDGYNELYQSLGSPKFKYNEYPVGDKYTGANLFNGKR